MGMFHFHFVKYEFHGYLWCVASLYEQPSSVCERVGILYRLLLGSCNSCIGLVLISASLPTRKALIGIYLRAISHFGLDVRPLFGAQGSELKTVMCSQAAGDLRWNAETA
jgi:hypothetical protein